MQINQRTCCFFSGLLLGIFFSFNAFGQVANSALLDLRQSNVNEIINLDGQWDFYWGELLLEEDLVQGAGYKRQLVKVPETWNGLTDALGKPLPSFGVATYHLKVLLPASAPDKLALKIRTAGTAYRFYVDGQLVASNGKVSKNKEQAAPEYKTKIVSFPVKGDTLSLLVQVSNFHHRKGGLWQSIQLGSDGAILQERETSTWRDIFLFSSVLIVGLYHLILYYYRRNVPANLIFSITSFALCLRALTVGEYLMTVLLPSMSWGWLLRLQYLAFEIPLITVPLFIRLLYRDYTFKYFQVGVNTVFGILIAFTLFSSTYMVSYVMVAITYLLPVVCAYCIGTLAYAALNKQKGALIFLFGALSLVITSVNDLLLNENIIQSMNMFTVGFYIFIFSQASVLAQNFSTAFLKNEQLNKELDDINHNLEETVMERTNSLQEANEELNTQNLQIAEQNEELEQQSQQLKKVNEEITSSIQYAKQIQRALLPSQEVLKKYFGEDGYFIFYQPRNIVSGDFYFVEEVDDKLIVVAADCTGHGVPGAFMSFIGIQSLTEIIIKNKITSPDLILNRLHEQVYKALRQSTSGNRDGMELSIICIDRNKNELQYAGAKNPLLIFKGKEEDLIKGDAAPIGGNVYQQDRVYTLHTIPLDEPVTFYMYSDGYKDQFGGKNNMKFMAKNFRRFLTLLHKDPMGEQESILRDNLFQWMSHGNEKQTDDILVMGFKL
ncbi:7TM diverse intracellular signaling domain-containing protein [Limibacter armeniacum]|uniref:7TM diverse intracellular signaling domain-containing protein n=1 Tax=Limibacter armeniacum TaxID=466084 RepID=UPI002FE5FA77